jgi:arginyl-tRNA synthetase
MKGVENGVFFKKEDGSIWVDLTGEGLDQKALLRRDGTAMYMTQDIGTAILRFRDFPDTAYQIYTVGNEQEYHFKVLFKVLKKLGWEQADKCYHLSYGMVELPEGKMKSREGTVVDADDLMAAMKDVAREVAVEQGKLEGLSAEEKEVVYGEIGMAALKYFLLRVDPVKNMLFNPRESIDFNGHTGPFIQYGYVRTRAILRKAAGAGLSAGVSAEHAALSAYEKLLIRKLHDFPTVIEEAATRYNPSIVANYAYELARDFNSFYQQCPILREEDSAIRQNRLNLVSKTGDVLKTSLYLLGINIVERM